jgi:hypothetical protein
LFARGGDAQQLVQAHDHVRDWLRAIHETFERIRRARQVRHARPPLHKMVELVDQHQLEPAFPGDFDELRGQLDLGAICTLVPQGKEEQLTMVFSVGLVGISITNAHT